VSPRLVDLSSGDRSVLVTAISLGLPCNPCVGESVLGNSFCSGWFPTNSVLHSYLLLVSTGCLLFPCSPWRKPVSSSTSAFATNFVNRLCERVVSSNGCAVASWHRLSWLQPSVSFLARPSSTGNIVGTVTGSNRYQLPSESLICNFFTSYDPLFFLLAPGIQRHDCEAGRLFFVQAVDYSTVDRRSRLQDRIGLLTILMVWYYCLMPHSMPTRISTSLGLIDWPATTTIYCYHGGCWTLLVDCL